MTVALRIHHLLACVPDLLSYRTCLYVGCNPQRQQLVPELLWAGYAVDVLEVFPAYVKALQEANPTTRRFRRICEGDVRTFQPAEDYDLVVWWHGPEHVEKAELADVLARLASWPRRLAVVGCPHGHLGQGVTKDGNEQQRHRWDCMPEDFRKLGWPAETLLPEPHGVRSHLIAWRRT
jgi:hypothetical protein